MHDAEYTQPLATGECRYFLARRTGAMAVELTDGCHNSPEGVAQAIKLYARIFKDDGPWLMVKIEDAPDPATAEIDEDSAGVCATLIEQARKG